MKLSTVSKPKVKAWVTKYALTKGIMEVEGSICTDIDVDMLSYDLNGYSNSAFKNEWFLTKKDAVDKADEMRLKKIKNLKKQILKFENLKF